MRQQLNYKEVNIKSVCVCVIVYKLYTLVSKFLYHTNVRKKTKFKVHVYPETKLCNDPTI